MDNGARGENTSSLNGNNRIISIEEYKGPGCVRKIVCTQGFFFMSPGLIEKYRVTEGDLLTPELEELLTQNSLRYECYWKSVDLLSRREHSAKMLSLKLKQRSFPEPIIREVVSALEQEGYVDDQRFAELYFSHLIRKKDSGKTKLRMKLQEKGLSREITEQLLSRVTEEDELQALENTAQKLQKRKGMDQNKLIRALVNRGFSTAQIFKLIIREK